MTTAIPAGIEVLADGVRLLTEAMVGRNPKAADADAIIVRMNESYAAADDDLRIAFDQVKSCMAEALRKGRVSAGKASMALSIAGDLLEQHGIEVAV